MILKKLRNKKLKIKEYSLKELIILKRKLVEEGKKLNEALLKTKLEENLYEYFEDRLNLIKNIQNDLVKVKLAIAELNLKTNNNENIYNYDSAKTMLLFLQKLLKFKKENHSKFFSKIKINREISTLKKEIEKLNKRMEKINEGGKIKLELTSNIE